jgi:hypothetical protein
VLRTSLYVLIFLFQCDLALAQLVVVPISKTPGKQKSTSKQSRIMAGGALSLPFWDDFSFSNSEYYPHDSLWLYGNSVSLNDGQAIHPPSKGVATFDGLDSLGLPYNVANPLQKGYADKLVSNPIALNTVRIGNRDSVFLSFFYQLGAQGENPDPGDLLVVEFLDTANHWVNQFTATYDVDMHRFRSPTPVIIMITSNSGSEASVVCRDLMTRGMSITSTSIRTGMTAIFPFRIEPLRGH